MSERLVTPEELRQAWQHTRERIAEAAVKAGRRPQDVLMVAVTKYAAPDQIRVLAELGQVDFGENRVQHLVQRVAQLNEFLARRRLLGNVLEVLGEGQGAKGKGQAEAGGQEAHRNHGLRPVSAKSEIRDQKSEILSSVRWHMIGHLQRNKIKQVLPLVRLVHSVDTLRLAEDLHAYGSKVDRTIDVLLQVNASGESTKFGVSLPAARHLAEQIDSMVNLRLRGLMTMAPYSENPEDARPVFARTAEVFQDLRSAGLGGGMCNILSMGMSGDFEVAIQEGANLVRVGRALFGEPDGVEYEDAEREAPADEDL